VAPQGQSQFLTLTTSSSTPRQGKSDGPLQYVASETVAKLEGMSVASGPGTRLIDANGETLGYVDSPPREVARMMAPVIPAEPGFEVVSMFLEEKYWRYESVPIIGWRITGGGAVPITAHNWLRRGGDWSLFQDGRQVGGYSTKDEWAAWKRKQYEERAANTAAARVAAKNKHLAAAQPAGTA
jgi:hypothetical protein